MNSDQPTYYATATDSSTGSLREEIGPFSTRHGADEACDELRRKWAIATTVRVTAYCPDVSR